MTHIICAVAIAAVLIVPGRSSAQEASAERDNVAPVYEGWLPNPDGSFDLLFGYFNRNWEGQIDVPIGAGNSIEPGGPDQGQPTRFYPRRTRFIFRIRVPKDFGKKELVWTVTSNGKTERTYASLKPDYILNQEIVEANSGGGGMQKNVAPALKLQNGRTLATKVGTPVTLTAIATDDGVPAARPGMPPGFGGRGAGVTAAAAGLRFSWFIYRGAGEVTFDPKQFSAWEDYRDGRNSPYSGGWVPPELPPDRTWIVRATFSEPGTYVLRALAHDGGLTAHEDVTVTVTR